MCYRHSHNVVLPSFSWIASFPGLLSKAETILGCINLYEGKRLHDFLGIRLLMNSGRDGLDKYEI